MRMSLFRTTAVRRVRVRKIRSVDCFEFLYKRLIGIIVRLGDITFSSGRAHFFEDAKLYADYDLIIITLDNPKKNTTKFTY